ncbi:copper resistance protein [Rhodovarius crocodyli]|uniref:Copper resistance protein n=1 Tax=Rhodovarius crocodyli TaxID=1979269 RepID=A0A437MD92_9PROT|nr:CopD family protein [Rhodovarius crocodyli]RVT95627.1 copper resistance protein [Rhodovarius crocodyli]
MELFLDLYGFLSVVLRALALIARSVTIGTLFYILLLATPLAARFQPGDSALMLDSARRIGLRAGWVTLGATLLAVSLGLVALMGSLDVGLAQALGAGFALSGAGVLGFTVLAMLALLPHGAPGGPRMAVLGLAALGMLASAALGSHAMAREEARGPMLLATFLHQMGAALWLGGLPAFMAALRLGWAPAAAQAVGTRYSGLAAAGVLCIIGGIIGFYLGYIGTPEGLYGTAYGAMSLTKSALMGFLLLLGLGNFLLLHHFARGHAATVLPRVRRFVECEMIAGICIFGIAASLTSVPPAVDLPDDRVEWHEIVDRFTPQAPRLVSPNHEDLAIPNLQAQLDAEYQARQAPDRPQAFIPGEGLLPPRNAFDLAWSEYNHNIAGFIVLAVGLAALLDATRRVPLARHWPLLFMGLAVFLFLRSDPEAWPMGQISFLDSLRDPEALQHKLLSFLVVIFAVSEWLVRLSGKRTAAAYVFPLSMAAGGFLLLAHTHAIANIREALLVELSHLPLGAAAVVAACARWVELRSEPDGWLARLGRWTWPCCLIFISLILIFYREA